MKCSADKHLLTEILKQDLGFDGFLISDYNAIDQISPDYKKDVEIAVNAGIDMVMLTDKYPELFKDLKELVDEGKIPTTRIDDAVTRILRVKFALGLMDKGRSPLADRSLHKSFGSDEHRAVARQAVRESLVLLKNEKKTLPLSKKASRIHVGGRQGADDARDAMRRLDHGLAGQDRQRGPRRHDHFGTAIKEAASGDAKVTYSADGKGAEGADVGVVVIGETPYAEFQGDSADLSLAKEDVEAFANMKKAGVPVVVVLLSGRPLILGDVLDRADALAAAWLPGSEGQGVADVLFGDYKPTGKLSHFWPHVRWRSCRSISTIATPDTIHCPSTDSALATAIDAPSSSSLSPVLGEERGRRAGGQEASGDSTSPPSLSPGIEGECRNDPRQPEQTP